MYRFMGAVLLDQQNNCSYCSARLAQCQAQKHAGYTQRTDVIFLWFLYALCPHPVSFSAGFATYLLRLSSGYTALFISVFCAEFALSLR